MDRWNEGRKVYCSGGQEKGEKDARLSVLYVSELHSNLFFEVFGHSPLPTPTHQQPILPGLACVSLLCI
jgi:hypothetical protein